MPESLLIDPIDNTEPISRFLIDEDEFNKATNRVHHSAFRPSRRGCFSTYRTKGLDNPEIWNIAQKFVTELREDRKDVLARAELQARDYTECKLILNPDGKPHPMHVNIEQWPTDREDILALRKTLANKARLVTK
ncbi:MAG: hypothetical protein HY893_08885 [Deltaproteobacteria bacterium]|nr:hypothetical protein [Deltaproteobacteria bacterium]